MLYKQHSFHNVITNNLQFENNFCIKGAALCVAFRQRHVKFRLWCDQANKKLNFMFIFMALMPNFNTHTQTWNIWNTNSKYTLRVYVTRLYSYYVHSKSVIHTTYSLLTVMLLHSYYLSYSINHLNTIYLCLIT